MYVIGTAGHVDHGKSTLVQALTGIDPDRLSEEKAREMTIDLGFAWLKLPAMAEEIGVVDVPGHRDFIENMLAGVGGIDLALLVIAADEGVMPQTKEHLAILDLLTVKGGLVVLTKTDLIDDPDWVELVSLEVAETLEGTALEGVDIVPVAAKTGQGMDELRQMIVSKLQAVPQRPDNGRPRLPIDRVFSLSGFGTVVTGTLLDGRLQLGQPVEIQPTGKTGRIRGLQSHKTKRNIVEPGSRVAVNISGIDKKEVKRGDVLAGEGIVRSTILCDATYRHLPDALGPLKHNTEVKLFVGATEVLARARVLGQEMIEPGQSGWVQFALRDPIAVLRGDRYIIRRPSPAETMGGGQIIDPHPGRQHRRFRPEVVQRLRTLESGTPGDLLIEKLVRVEPANLKKFKRQAGLEEADFNEALEEALQEQKAVLLEGQLLSWARCQRYLGDLRHLVGQFHRQHPLRLGMSREELRSRIGVSAVLFAPLLERSDLVQDGALVREDSHTVQFSAEQQNKIDQLLGRFNKSGVESPSVKEAKAAVGEELFFALIDLGYLKTLSTDVVYAEAEYERIIQQIKDYLTTNGQISAAQTRDLLNTSRKYAIALLEHLDAIKVTKRQGDVRILLN